jgi:tetratricopeptide (TPR) repeat protein
MNRPPARSSPGRFMIAALSAATVVTGAGCANPVNRVTSDRYAETCDVAERAGDFAVAEQACYRALVNVDWGNLGPELKSQRLYNLARNKKHLEKFDEAIALLRQSLAIEEKLSGPTSLQTGRRLIELAANESQVGRWSDGADDLDRAVDIAPGYSGRERAYAKAVFELYATERSTSGEAARTGRFAAVASSL